MYIWVIGLQETALPRHAILSMTCRLDKVLPRDDRQLATIFSRYYSAIQSYAENTGPFENLPIGIQDQAAFALKKRKDQDRDTDKSIPDEEPISTIPDTFIFQDKINERQY